MRKELVVVIAITIMLIALISKRDTIMSIKSEVSEKLTGKTRTWMDRLGW